MYLIAAGLVASIVFLTSVWTQNLVASVYQDTKKPINLIENILGKNSDRSLIDRRYIVNGQPLVGKLTQSHQSPLQILKALFIYWDQTHPENKTADEIQQLVDRLNKPIASRGDNWSLFANLLLLKHPRQKSIEPHSDRFIVLSMQLDPNQLTDVWTFRIPDGVNPLAMFNLPGNQAPPVPDSPIVPVKGSNRAWSISERTDLGSTHLEIYEGAGSIEQYRHHFVGTLSEIGYRLDEDIQLGKEKYWLMFSNRQGQIDVSISESANTGSIIAVVQLRN